MSNLKFGDFFKKADPLKPAMNVGCLFDIPTSGTKYHLGKHGESILNGGLSAFTSVTGRGNTFKSAIANFLALRSLDRYDQAALNFYDTELTMSASRLMQLSQHMDYIASVDLEGEGRLLITDKAKMYGNQWFDGLKEYAKAKIAHPKETLGTTPFMDKDGNLIKYFYGTVGIVDSLSAMEIEDMEKNFERHTVGSSDRNTEHMRNAGAKSTMVEKTPGVAASAGIYVIMTAHAGDGIQMDPYAPQQKKLMFLKNGLKFKKAPENITFFPNVSWFTHAASVHKHDATKGPMYPRDPKDTMKGDTDLMLVTLQALRNKSGPTGFPYDVIVSQSEGLLVQLTEFHYLKTNGRYGLEGNDKTFQLALLPEVNLTRTTIRSKCEDDARLRRGFEITSEMCQISLMWHDLADDLKCTPKELYDDLKAKGYDWDVLLNTRGYWVFEETKHPLNFLSTMDLLKMRAGRYHPYWMKDNPTKK